MASPQLPNGFTQIANEILDELCLFPFNGSQYAIIVKIIRMTYGFKRKDHDFAISFLVDSTQISYRTIKKELSWLIDKRVLQVTKEATYKESRRLSFNKDYDSWLIQRRGENMDPNECREGKDCSPLTNDSEGKDRSPLEGKDCSPLTLDLGLLEGKDCSPMKERSNKDLKEKDLKEIIDSRFEEFWSFYPKKVGKKDALRFFNRLHKDKKFNWDDFITGTKNYVAYCKQEGRYLKDGSSYVNQETYKDFIDLPTVEPSNELSTQTGKISERTQSTQDAIKRLFNKE